MNQRKFDRILDECLSRMDRGESLIDILASYPSQAKNLKPLMLAAMLSRAVPQPVPGYTALRMGKNEMLAEMASMQAEGIFLKPKPFEPPRETILDRWTMFIKGLQPAYRFAMLTMVVILTGGFFTVSASASGMAEDIMDTLFFSFEQVGELLLIRPSPPGIMGDNPIFFGDYDLPDSPQNHSGGLKGFLVDGDDKGEDDQFGEEFLTQIQTREYSLTDKYEIEEGEVEVKEVDDVIDAKDLEKEEKEEDKELEKEEKEEEKDLKEEEKAADKAEKEDEKEADKAEKEAEKEEKEDEKEKDK